MIMSEPSLVLELDRAISMITPDTGLKITRAFATKAADNQVIKRIMKGGMLERMKADSQAIHQMAHDREDNTPATGIKQH